jgi:hypothetical protein
MCGGVPSETFKFARFIYASVVLELNALVMITT